MVIDDFQRGIALRCVIRLGGKLESQAFGQVARADADRLKMLQVLKSDRQVVVIHVEFRRQHFADFFERLRQITVVAQRIDQQADQALVALRQVEQRQLRRKMRAQARRLFGERPVVVIFIVVAAGAAVGRAVFDIERGWFFRARRRFLSAVGRCGGHFGVFRLRRFALRRGGVGSAIDPLQQRIILEQALDFLVEFERRQLQQPDRLLQLRRQCQVLR